MQTLTEDGRRIVEAVGKRHGISSDAVYQLLLAIAAGGGRQAQFNHAELGGMGQWSQGGMTMIGDMFNQPLKARVEALCSELAGFIQGKGSSADDLATGQSQGAASPKRGAAKRNRLFISTTPQVVWPEELGAPSSSGSQNDMHYAVFPQTRRLAIAQSGRIIIYDTADHLISGLAQQQGNDQSLTLTSQNGLVSLSDLAIVSTGISKGARRVRARTATKAPAAPVEAAAPAAAESPAAQTPPKVHAAPPALSITVAQSPAPAAAPAAKPEPIPATSDDEIFSRIERLADLRKKDIITAAEFDAKKTELLARL